MGVHYILTSTCIVTLANPLLAINFHQTMPFTIYLHNKSFLPSNAATREAALYAAVHTVNRLREGINEAFGIREWAVVI
jgi:hypothetical protein